MASYLKKKRWSRKDGGRALDAADASGLSDRAFAERHGLDRQRLSKRRSLLGRPRSTVRGKRAVARGSSAVATRRGRRRESRAMALDFVEVRPAVTMAARTVEIRLRNGRSVVLSMSAVGPDLAELLALVEGGTC